MCQMKLCQEYMISKPQLNIIMHRLNKLSFAPRFSSQKSQLVKLSGFQLKESFYSEDYKTQFNRLQHKNTGCAIYQFANNDINNAFASMARTIPKNDKGCPHILEHIACCGSQKFPVRDPFFTMLRRSVNTYMNAWTGEDFTCYPFSSANPKDWFNLYYVYLDMTMKPLLNELDFRQEGWRYEINEQGIKQLKGIVLNQMKGAYQSSERQLIISLSKNLLGNTSYAYDSGGKPSEIVKLSYEELKQMHNYYYHPSNMGFFYYGNNEVSEKLKYLQEAYLNNYKKEAHQFHKILKPVLTKKYEQIYSKNAETTSIIIGYYLKNIEEFDPIDVACLRILNYILLNTNQAEFYRVFIQSGLAQTIGDSGLNFSKLSVFSLTLKGISNELKQQQFRHLFEETLQKLGNQGIPANRLQQYKNLLELDILLPKKNNGLRLLSGLVPYLNHRVNFSSLLQPRKTLKQALQKIKDKKYLQDLIDKYFLKNEHYSIIKQLQSPQNAEQKEESYEGLQIAQSKILEQQQKLQERQTMKQNLDLLPSLKIQDLIQLPMKKKSIVQTFENIRTHKKYTHHHIQIDQDIFYYRFVFNIKQPKQHFLTKINLFNYAINKGISAGKYNHKELASMIANYTSDFSFKLGLAHDQSANLIITACCLKQNKVKLFEILDMIILSPKFEKDNLDRIFKSYENEVIQSLTQQPMEQCLDYCGSFLTKKGYLSNSYLKLLGGLEIVQNFYRDGTFDDVLQDIKNAAQIEIIQHSNIQTEDLPLFLNNLVDKKAYVPQALPVFQTKQTSIAVTRDYHINFCSQQFIGPRFMSQDHAFINLALQIMQQKYLHPQIRQKGGAYGARGVLRSNDLIALYSYMDPNPERTFQVFKESIDNFLNKQELTDKDLFQAKIAIIGRIDQPVTPQSEHVNLILKKYSPANLKEYKQKIKQATMQNLLNAVKKYMKDTKTSRVLFGNKIPTQFKEQKLIFPSEK